jgi:hypothetical protein
LRFTPDLPPPTDAAGVVPGVSYSAESAREVPTEDRVLSVGEPDSVFTAGFVAADGRAMTGITTSFKLLLLLVDEGGAATTISSASLSRSDEFAITAVRFATAEERLPCLTPGELP